MNAAEFRSAREAFARAVRESREVAGITQHSLAKIARLPLRRLQEVEAAELLPATNVFNRMTAAIPRLVHLRPMLRELRDAALSNEKQAEAPPPRPVNAAVLERKAFPEMLAELREAEGLTQQDLAELIGVAAASVGYWESGRNLPVREHWTALVAWFPALAEVEPFNIQDIPPPVGGPGAGSLPAPRPPSPLPPPTFTPETPSSPVLEPGTTMQNPPSPPSPAAVPPARPSPRPRAPDLPPPLGGALGVWLDRILRLAGAPNADELADVLDAAARDGIAVGELAGLIRRARAGMEGRS